MPPNTPLESLTPAAGNDTGTFDPKYDIYADPTERRQTLKSRMASSDNESLGSALPLKYLFEKHNNVLKDSTDVFTEENKENKPTGHDLEAHPPTKEDFDEPNVFAVLSPTAISYNRLLNNYQRLWESIYGE